MPVHSVNNMCSHLQNACRASLGTTSVPYRKYNVLLAAAMHKAGLISYLYRGGPTPPDPEEIETVPPPPITNANVATRRLWLGLKYVDNEPVMRNLTAISKPSRLVTSDMRSLSRIINGIGTVKQPGLTLGELLFVATDLGVVDAREAVEKKRGGLLLCRVS